MFMNSIFGKKNEKLLNINMKNIYSFLLIMCTWLNKIGKTILLRTNGSDLRTQQTQTRSDWITE